MLQIFVVGCSLIFKIISPAHSVENL